MCITTTIHLGNVKCRPGWRGRVPASGDGCAYPRRCTNKSSARAPVGTPLFPKPMHDPSLELFGPGGGVAGEKPKKKNAAVAAFWFLKASRSEEHTSELQSLMRTSYAVFCL